MRRPSQENYRVMVHFLDADDELMWTDDHQPPVPTTQWKPGQTIEYTRTMFVPIYPLRRQGQRARRALLAEDAKRLPLAGADHRHSRVHGRVAAAAAALRERVPAVQGRLAPGRRRPQRNSAVEWQWTKKTATISFRNPKKPSIFYLHATTAPTSSRRRWQLKVNGQQVETITVTPKQEFIHKTPLTVQQLGPATWSS